MQTRLSTQTLNHYANDGAEGIASALANHKNITAMAQELLRFRNATAGDPGRRWEHIIGKVLKDWATAIMRTNRNTRAEAREIILTLITALKNVEESKAFLLTKFDTDHLPEGSH
jgi:hypothetical protein